MLSSYSWLDFILITFAGVVVWYTIILLLYFRSEIADLFSGKLIRRKPAEVSTSAKVSADSIIGGYKEKPDPLALEGIAFKTPENGASRDTLKEAVAPAKTEPITPMATDQPSQIAQGDKQLSDALSEIENGGADIALATTETILREQPLEPEERSMLDSDLFIQMLYDGTYLEPMAPEYQTSDFSQDSDKGEPDEATAQLAGEDNWGAANF